MSGMAAAVPEPGQLDFSTPPDHKDVEGANYIIDKQVPNRETPPPTSSSSQQNTPITLAVKNLNFFVHPVRWYHRILKTGLAERHNAFTSDTVSRESSSLSSMPDEIQLLKNINLIVKPGELVAIMGPSGSGKTTLLGAIAGKAKGRLEGNVLFNGQNLKAHRLRGNVTMLGCQDKMLPFLNVEQTLQFAALLKMPGSTASERRAKIEEIIEELSLIHVAKTRIGNSVKKGLSTGEMRRTSIAQELIANPMLLLLDEPTSGLDAVLAYELMHVLRRIALGGRSVICAIHQPRSLSFYLAHKVIIMSQGEIIYAGPSSGAKKFFTAALGPHMPTDLNIADTVIDVASNCDSHKLQSGKLGGGSDECGQPLAAIVKEAYEMSEEAQEILRGIQAEEQREYGDLVRYSRNPVVQWLMEVIAVFYRSFMNSFQNPWGIFSTILIQLATGCLLGCIFLTLPKKYLPAHRPIDISDPNSSAMKLLDAKWAHFAATGIDGQGTNPFVDMVVNGVDGHQSQPIEVLKKSRIPYYFGNMMPCTHKRLMLDQMPDYVNVDFRKHYERWGVSLGSEELRDNDNSDRDLVLGSSMPEMVTNILMTLEVADYALYKHDWYNSWRVCRGARSASALTGCYPLISSANNLLAPANECVGLPSMPYKLVYMGASQFFRNYPNADSLKLDNQEYPSNFKLAHPNAAKTKGGAPPFGWRRKMKDHLAKKDKESDSSNVATYSVDFIGIADRGSEKFEKISRKLQASALVGAGSGDLLSSFPSRFRLLKPAIDNYIASLRKCQHPICKKIVSKMDKPKDPTTSSSTILDYAAVLGAVLNIAGCLFFAVANVGFASYDGIVTVCEERPLVNKETANYAYRPTTYFIGKCAADFLFQLLPLAAVIISFYYIVGFEWGIHEHYFGGFFGICIATMFAAYGFSYMVAALCPSMETAVVAAPMLIVILLCCSGFFVRDSAIPSWMAWCKYLSIYRWGFFALCLNQFPTGQSYWGLPNSFNLALIGITETSIGKCVGVLIALGFGFRLVAVLPLKFLHKNEGLE